MHLDLRPENVMRQYNPNTGKMDYWLLDLGMAQQWGDTKPHEAPANILFSSFGAMQGSHIEPWADQEALAHCILHLEGLQLPWFHCSEGYEVLLIMSTKFIGRISALTRSKASEHCCSPSDDGGVSVFASHVGLASFLAPLRVETRLDCRLSHINLEPSFSRIVCRLSGSDWTS